MAWVRIVDDLETPVSAFLKIGHGRPYAFLFESVEGGAWRGRYSIVALEPDLIWRAFGDRAEICTGEDMGQGLFKAQAEGTLQSLRDVVAASRIDLPEALPPMAAGLFGVLGYDMIRLAEPVGPAKPDALGLPDAVMMRPSVVAIFDSVGGEIILATPVRPGPDTADQAYAAAGRRLEKVVQDLRRPLTRKEAQRPAAQAEMTSKVTREAYGQIVERARGYIKRGDVFQVVPSHRFSRPFEGDGFSLYRSLRRLNPSPFLFYLNFGDFELVGSSPEILVRLRDGKLTIRPIAGTRRRGANQEEDQALERELLADPKERAEHLMLLDLGRNDVGRAILLNQAGRNHPPATPRYSHVMHIVSNVEGDAPEGLDPVDVILTALPAGTLSGAPKIRAMQIIDELETEKRGVAYAGAAGYISSDGGVDTCIVLRTALLKDGIMYVQAGGGVVADSDPNSEYEETLQKSRALRNAAEEAWRFN